MSGHEQTTGAVAARGGVRCAWPGSVQIGLWLTVVCAAVALSLANLWFGDLNQDEGWYLYSAGELWRGRLPFVDFATTQGPVFPFVYAAAGPLVARWGIAGGRLFTVLLGGVAVALAAWLAARMTDGSGVRVRRLAALLTVAVVGVNVYQAYFFAIVKTYALTAVLLMGGLHLLLAAWRRGRGGWAFGAGIALGLAAAVRSSAGFAIPVAWAGLLWEFGGWRGGGADAEATPATEMSWWRRVGPATLFAAGACVSLALSYGPFIVMSPRGVWFALVEYHAGRSAGGLLPWLAFKAGFVARLLSAYLAAWLLLWWLAVRAWAAAPGGRTAVSTGDGRFARMGWALLATVTFVHVAAPFPYDDYQVFLFPLLGALLGAALAAVRTVSGPVGRRPYAAAILTVGVCLLAAAASPMIWDWFVGPRDRIWWPLKEKPPLAVLREAGRVVRAMTGPEDTILTQDTYLAVEAGRRVPAGLEMGPFCYFPDWSDDKARTRHVVNRAMMERLLNETPSPVAAFSGYGLAIRCPEVSALGEDERAALWDAVNRRYEPVRQFERFGQAYTTMVLMRRRTSGNDGE